jgi:hypothetical protein
VGPVADLPASKSATWPTAEGQFMDAGRKQAPSTFHRYLAGLAAEAQLIPRSVVHRTLDLAAVSAARLTAGPRPGWTAVFTKALALVAVRQPALRQSWQTWPRTHLYEHPVPVAAVAVERPLDEELPGVWATVAEPDRLAVLQTDALLKRFREDPAERLDQVQHWQKYCRRPAWLRRVGWWLETGASGRRRAERLGTFALAGMGGLDADLGEPLYPVAAVLTWGPITAQGWGQVRLSFDARLLSCGAAARLLGEVERVLASEVVRELGYLRQLDAA